MLPVIHSENPTSRVWYLVASGHKARTYRLERKVYDRPTSWTRRHPLKTRDVRFELEPVPGMSFKAEPLDVFERKRKGHTVTPHGNIARDRKKDFVRDVGESLEKAHAQQLFDRLVLVAPARFLARLKATLTTTIKEKIAQEVPKDLTFDDPSGQVLAERLDGVLVMGEGG